MHQHCVGADGLDLLPRNGQVLFPAQQAEQPGPPQQDQALQTGGGGIKGQIIGPAQATPCSSCTTSFSQSSRMVTAPLPSLPPAYAARAASMQKAVEKHRRVVVYWSCSPTTLNKARQLVCIKVSCLTWAA